jgi:hypothetical protein
VLSKAAFDVKTRTMPHEADRFTHRRLQFFRANSKVIPAAGTDINTMAATVGFKPKANDSSHSVEDLEQQENGGQIGNRAFIALPAARTGGTWGGMVKSKFTLKTINSRMSIGTKSSIVDSLKSRGANNKQKFTIAAALAGKGGFVLGTDRRNGNRYLMHINSVHRLNSNDGETNIGNTVVNSTAIYIVKQGRKVTPNSRFHGFMRTASLQSAARMQGDFMVLAEKRIMRL